MQTPRGVVADDLEQRVVRDVMDGAHRVEAHLLGLPTSCVAGASVPDWSPIGDLPEYGWRIALRFVARLRDPIGFGSLDRLTEQLARDCARAAERLEAACPAPAAGGMA